MSIFLFACMPLFISFQLNRLIVRATDALKLLGTATEQLCGVVEGSSALCLAVLPYRLLLTYLI